MEEELLYKESQGFGLFLHLQVPVDYRYSLHFEALPLLVADDIFFPSLVIIKLFEDAIDIMALFIL